MKIRQIVLVDQEVRSEGGRELARPTRRVAAAAVLENPLAGKPPADDLAPLVELSVQAGELLTGRAVGALRPLKPRGYGKAALVGTAGDLEHGAAMIHVRIGLAMRQGAGGGPALIPGNAKVGAPGTPIDVVFGGIEDAWDYDAMDTMQLSRCPTRRGRTRSCSSSRSSPAAGPTRASAARRRPRSASW
jgi:hypothetical protein